MATGVSTADFTAIHADLKRTVTYQVVTKTLTSFNADEKTAYAAGVSKDVIFFNQDKRYIFDKEGLIELGDAYIMAPTSEGIKRFDQFSIGGEKYYVKSVIRRTILQVTMFDIGVCFKVE